MVRTNLSIPPRPGFSAHLFDLCADVVDSIVSPLRPARSIGPSGSRRPTTVNAKSAGAKMPFMSSRRQSPGVRFQLSAGLGLIGALIERGTMAPGFLLGGHYEEHRPAQLILHLCVAFYQISVGAGSMNPVIWNPVRRRPSRYDVSVLWYFMTSSSRNRVRRQPS